MCVLAEMCIACFQANTNADTITPTTTAIAKSAITVTNVTKNKTNASSLLTPRMILNDAHSNVPITTMNITPTRAANGIISINCDANKIKPSKTNAAVIPDKRPRPPELILIID